MLCSLQAVQGNNSSPWAFDEIKGCDEAKHELQEMVDLMKSPDQLFAVKAHAPKGVLLVGPPGKGCQWPLHPPSNTLPRPPTFPSCPSKSTPFCFILCQCLAYPAADSDQ